MTKDCAESPFPFSGAWESACFWKILWFLLLLWTSTEWQGAIFDGPGFGTGWALHSTVVLMFFWKL